MQINNKAKHPIKQLKIKQSTSIKADSLNTYKIQISIISNLINLAITTTTKMTTTKQTIKTIIKQIATKIKNTINKTI